MTLEAFKSWLDGYLEGGGIDLDVIRAQLAGVRPSVPIGPVRKWPLVTWTSSDSASTITTYRNPHFVIDRQMRRWTSARPRTTNSAMASNIEVTKIRNPTVDNY